MDCTSLILLSCGKSLEIADENGVIDQVCEVGLFASTQFDIVTKFSLLCNTLHSPTFVSCGKSLVSTDQNEGNDQVCIVLVCLPLHIATHT